MKNINLQNSGRAELCLSVEKQLVNELVAKATIDGKRDIQVEFRAKIMDQEVRKKLLDFPNGGEIVVRL